MEGGNLRGLVLLGLSGGDLTSIYELPLVLTWICMAASMAVHILPFFVEVYNKPIS